MAQVVVCQYSVLPQDTESYAMNVNPVIIRRNSVVVYRLDGRL
jgi:hypothetical protein